MGAAAPRTVLYPPGGSAAALTAATQRDEVAASRPESPPTPAPSLPLPNRRRPGTTLPTVLCGRSHRLPVARGFRSGSEPGVRIRSGSGHSQAGNAGSPRSHPPCSPLPRLPAHARHLPRGIPRPGLARPAAPPLAAPPLPRAHGAEAGAAVRAPGAAAAAAPRPPPPPPCRLFFVTAAAARGGRAVGRGARRVRGKTRRSRSRIPGQALPLAGLLAAAARSRRSAPSGCARGGRGAAPGPHTPPRAHSQAGPTALGGSGGLGQPPWRLRDEPLGLCHGEGGGCPVKPLV